MCVFGEDESHTDRRARGRRQFLPRPAHTALHTGTVAERRDGARELERRPTRSARLAPRAPTDPAPPRRGCLFFAQTFIDALRAPSLSSASSSSPVLLPRSSLSASALPARGLFSRRANRPSSSPNRKVRLSLAAESNESIEIRDLTFGRFPASRRGLMRLPAARM